MKPGFSEVSKPYGAQKPDAAYHIVLSEQTLTALLDYKADLATGKARAGARLQARLAEEMNAAEFTEALLATKQPRIFAESEIRCDGTDWNHRELALLGDISVEMKAEIFDNGVWDPHGAAFQTHRPPLKGILLFMPGPLLATGSDFYGQSPDYTEVTTPAGKIDPKNYTALIERRILPLLHAANEAAQQSSQKALVVLPGIGAGAFTGKFKGEMGLHLDHALRDILARHGAALPHIGTVYFDPFNEGENDGADFHGIHYRRRPALQNPAKPQLSRPQVFAEAGEDLSGHLLCKIVAWDHASLPGNDFFAGSRFTDDGVAAAATNSMESVTGISGHYRHGVYKPPKGYKDWDDVASKHQTKLSATPENIRILTADGRYISLETLRPSPNKPLPPRP